LYCIVASLHRTALLHRTLYCICTSLHRTLLNSVIHMAVLSGESVGSVLHL